MLATYRVSVSTGPVLAFPVARHLATFPTFRAAHDGTAEAHVYVSAHGPEAAESLVLAAVLGFSRGFRERDVRASRVTSPASHPAGAVL